jgi:hypothetical protein
MIFAYWDYKLLELNVDFAQPEFGSALIFELRQSLSNPRDYFIQIYRKNNIPGAPVEAKLVKICGSCL